MSDEAPLHERIAAGVVRAHELRSAAFHRAIAGLWRMTGLPLLTARLRARRRSVAHERGTGAIPGTRPFAH